MQKPTFKNIVYDAIALISGAVLTIAFAPVNFYFLALLAPASFLLTLGHCGIKRAIWRGGLFGLGFFGTGASWIFVSIHLYGPAPVPLALLLTSLFVVALAAYFALFAFVFKKFFHTISMTSYLLAFPALWVLFEALRGYLFTGFPWLFLGYSQTNSPLAAFIPILGTYGLSFLMALTSGAIAFAVEMRKNVFFVLVPVISLVALFCLGSMLRTLNWTSRQGGALHVSLIQGNIPQNQKWDPQFIHDIMTRYVDLTRQELRSDIIVWPEAAVPIPLPYANKWLMQLANMAREHDAILVVGAVSENAHGVFTNSMLALGRSNDIYDKRKLVPFGEYVPFESYLRGLIQFFDLPMSHIEAGNTATSTLLHSDSVTILPMICYEVAYVSQLQEVNESDIVITISNDAWFGHSIGPAQHLQIAQARALESGRYVLRATNSGITAIISPYGEIVSQIPQFEVGVLRGQVYAMSGETPFMRIGYIKLLWCMAVLLFASLFMTLNGRGSKRP